MLILDVLLLVQESGTEGPGSGVMGEAPGPCIRLMQQNVFGLSVAD